MKCFISSQCSAHSRIVDSVAQLRALGFSRIELTGGTIWYDALEQDILAFEQTTGVEFMVHNYFPAQKEEFVLNLALVDEKRRLALFKFIRDMALRARRMGASVLGIHPGFRQDVNLDLINGFFSPGERSAASEGAFWDSLPVLDQIASDVGIRICIENLAPRDNTDRFSFVSHAEEIHELLKRVRKTRSVGMLVDLGHLNVASHHLGFSRESALADILRNSERVFQFHLSHNDGSRDAHEPNPNGCWQVDFVSEHSSRFESIPVVLEWSRSATVEGKQRFDEVSEIIEKS